MSTSKLLQLFLGLTLLNVVLCELNLRDSSTESNELQTSTTYERTNAAIVMMVRRTHLDDVVTIVNQVEDHFNAKFHYDWIFLDKKEPSDEFKQVTSGLVSGSAKYGIAPNRHVCPRDWHDKSFASLVHDTFRGVLPYRYNDSDFESIVLERDPHPLLDQYMYNWKIEPDTNLHCDIEYDVFKYMEAEGHRDGSTVMFSHVASDSHLEHDNIGQYRRNTAWETSRLMGYLIDISDWMHKLWSNDPDVYEDVFPPEMEAIRQEPPCPWRYNRIDVLEDPRLVCNRRPFSSYFGLQVLNEWGQGRRRPRRSGKAR